MIEALLLFSLAASAEEPEDLWADEPEDEAGSLDVHRNPMPVFEPEPVETRVTFTVGAGDHGPSVVERKRSELVYCHERAQADLATFVESGVTVSATLDEGRVTALTVTPKTEVVPPSLVTCIERRSRRWVFPRTQPEEITFQLDWSRPAPQRAPVPPGLLTVIGTTGDSTDGAVLDMWSDPELEASLDDALADPSLQAVTVAPSARISLEPSDGRPKDITDAARRRLGSLEACVSTPAAAWHGSLVTVVEVSDSGRVDAVLTRSPDGAPEGMTDCVSKAIQRWRFPKGHLGSYMLPWVVTPATPQDPR